MTDTQQESAFAQAALWHARIEGEVADWEAFARWLDADPMNQKAYEQLALIDDETTRWARARGEPEAPASVPPAQGMVAGRWWVGGAAIAASLVAMISVPLVRNQTSPPVYYSADKEQKLVTLADGSSARLDRGTRLAVADGGKGPIRIEAGAAFFAVRHDPARAFIVQTGDVTITDIGTQFEVTRRGRQVAVAVEEGSVDVSWQGNPATRLSAGQTFAIAGEGQTAIVRKVDPASVASWRDGRLIYDDQPLSLVAADISRYTPDPISVDPAVADVRLSGILLIEDGSHLVDQIKALLPVDSRPEAGHVRLVRAASRR